MRLNQCRSGPQIDGNQVNPFNEIYFDWNKTT